MTQIDLYDKTQTDSLIAGKADDNLTVHLASASVDDIGTNLKPIKIVDGVAVAVDYDLVDTQNGQNINGSKTFLAQLKRAGSNPWITFKETTFDDNSTLPLSDDKSARLRFANNNETEFSYLGMGINKAGDGYMLMAVKDATSGNDGRFIVRKYANGTAFATAPSRTYNPANTSDVVTQGSLASNPEVVHTTGNETIAGIKQFEPGNGSVRVARTHNGNGFDVKALDYDVTEHSNTQYPPSAIAVYDKNDELYYQIRAVQNTTGEVSVYLRVRNADGTGKDILLGAGDPPASP